MHLVGFIIRIYHDACSPERLNKACVCRYVMFSKPKQIKTPNQNVSKNQTVYKPLIFEK